jgi:F-type H+-transporting ATPase subunit gamma
MQTLEALSRRIATTEDLRAIVRTMKSLSAVSIRQYESAVAALRDYGRTVELALQALLRDRPAVARAGAPATGTAAVVVFGSDHGLCGRFNDEVAHFAHERLRELDAAGTRRRCLGVGARAEARLAALGEVMDERLVLPGSVGGLSALAHAVLVQIDAWGAVEGLGRVLLIHHRRTSEAVAVPHMRQLLPLSPERLRNLAARPWPSRRLPMFTMEAERLFPAVIRQYLFSAVYRAAAESLASEHASRLASMQAAERSIEEHLEDQQAEFRRRRQETITEELLDIVIGFEASASASGAGFD